MKHVSKWMAAGWILVMGDGMASAQRASELVTPQVLADVSAVQAGKPFHLGVLLQIAPKWHVYWKNPGDSGLAATVTYDLPEGFKASTLQYPVPVKFQQPGDLVAYGYGDEVMLVTTVTPPATLLEGGSIPLRAKVKFLVCESVCIPGKAELPLSLPIAAKATPANEEVFAKWKSQVPVRGEAAAAIAEVETTGKANQYTIDLTWKTATDNVEFFPGKTAALNIHDVTVINKNKQTRVTFTADTLAGQHPDAPTLESVVVYTDAQGARRGIDVSVPINAK